MFVNSSPYLFTAHLASGSDRLDVKQTLCVPLFLYVDRDSLISRTLVLILGMCFFAGGLRFSEQGFHQSKPNCRTDNHY